DDDAGCRGARALAEDVRAGGECQRRGCAEREDAHRCSSSSLRGAYRLTHGAERAIRPLSSLPRRAASSRRGESLARQRYGAGFPKVRLKKPDVFPRTWSVVPSPGCCPTKK